MSQICEAVRPRRMVALCPTAATSCRAGVPSRVPTPGTPDEEQPLTRAHAAARTLRRSSRLRRAAPVLLAAAGIASVAVAANPGAVAGTVRHFDLRAVIPLVTAAAALCLLQGWRWHRLLRAVGVRQRARRSHLLNLAGQAVTAVVPLGDLTRALLASEASGVPFGAVAATVTVQELTFTLLLVLAAAPGMIRFPGGVVLMAAVVAGVAGIVAILSVSRFFTVVRRGVAVTPGLRRLSPQIDTLQQQFVHLLRRPDVLAGGVLDLGRVLVATAAMLLILRGLGVNTLGWWEAALVVAVSYVGGAISLLPGGVGANEASVVGILLLLGVDPAHAAAAALLQRLWLTGFASAGGLAALAILRRLRIRDGHAPRQLSSGLVPSVMPRDQPVLIDRSAACLTHMPKEGVNDESASDLAA
jgi:uncharacterized protein (TIRG00374 family)